MVLCAVSTASAVDCAFDFESYSAGGLVGQDGWTCCGRRTPV